MKGATKTFQCPRYVIRFCKNVFSTGVSIVGSFTWELFLRLTRGFVKVASTVYG